MSGHPPAGAADAPLLEARGLAVAAGPTRLVDGCSFAVRGGETWALVGRNGAGKTTLLHALAGLVEPIAGSIELAGRPLDAWRPGEAARLRGFVPQVIRDAFGMTVLEAVLAGRHPHLGTWTWESDADRAVALEALASLDLGTFAHRDVRTLSGGERARVALAAVLAQDVPLLLLDEPVAHLDLHHQVGVLRTLAELARTRGRGIVLSIHDVNLAARFATHAVVIAGGRARCGPAGGLLTAAVLSEAYGHALDAVQGPDSMLFVAR